MKNRVTELRKKAKLTQQALSDSLGFSSAYVSQVENGIEPPSDKFKAAAAKFFKVSEEEIFPKGAQGRPGVVIEIPEATARRAEGIMNRAGYSSLEELAADAVRRLVETTEDRMSRLKGPNGTQGHA